MLICQRCQNSLLEKSNFCPYCGKMLSPEGKLPLEDIPLVFLRADLSGFTSLSESLEAEDVMQFLNSLFEDFCKIIEKYRGILYQIIGDEIVGIFGLTHETEYTPHLAVMAVEEIVKRVKDCEQISSAFKECKIKCGIELAQASIYNIVGNLQSAIIVTDGFAKSLILQRNAGNNSVLVGETFYQATRSVFEYEEYGELVESHLSIRAYKLKLR